MLLTDDAQAILLLCSHLGLPKENGLAPLNLKEWNGLARRIAASRWQRPGALLNEPAEAVRQLLEVEAEDAERFASLLARGGTLALELERLESLGIWALTRADEKYPARYRQRLKESAPPVLFGAGTLDLMGQPGLAVVGSRNIDEARNAFAEFIGNACAQAGWVVYSGAARGVDAVTMGAALEARGQVVGVLADSLEKAIRAADAREAVARGDLTLFTPYNPNAGFSVGAAMGRNKLIYALADYALVIASDVEKGGTWAGATEALKTGWVPVFVLDGPDVPEGNRRLLQMGGQPFPQSFRNADSLQRWLVEHSIQPPPTVSQSQLL